MKSKHRKDQIDRIDYNLNMIYKDIRCSRSGHTSNKQSNGRSIEDIYGILLDTITMVKGVVEELKHDE